MRPLVPHQFYLIARRKLFSSKNLTGMNRSAVCVLAPRPSFHQHCAPFIV